MVASIVLYLFLSITGIFYGLPDKDRILSYNCDETTWVEGLSLIKAERGYNPHPQFVVPTGYLLMYGAAIGFSAVVNYIPLNKSKEWFREHPDKFARFYLVGRTLQIVCGLILLMFLWGVFGAVFGSSVANTFALIISVTPAFISTSHFSQASMPVALLCNMSIGVLLYGARQAKPHRLWFYVAAALAGYGLGTKLSALALVVPLIYYGVVFHRRSLKVLFISAFVFVLAFFLACPFALLSLSKFWATIFINQKDNQLPMATIFQGVVFLFRIPLRFSLGVVLEILCFSALAFFITQKNEMPIRILLVWIFSFLAAVLRVGQIANSARVFVVIPALIVLSALIIDRAGPWKRTIIWALILITLFPTLGILRSRWEPLIQKESSAWMEQNIPYDKTIGLLRNPFWYSPDIVVKSFHHPERHQNVYPLRVVDYSMDKIQSNLPDYFVISYLEKNRCQVWQYPPDCLDVVKWIEHGDAYEMAKTFPREIQFHGWKWSRPEYDRYPFYDDHDLWRTSLYIYRRKNLVSATRS